MPLIRVTVADPGLPTTTQDELVDGLTRLAAQDLGRPPDRTVVIVDLVPPERYFVVGRPHDRAVGAHVAVGVTVCANSAEEKSRFIYDTYDLLRESLGAVPPFAGVALYEMGAARPRAPIGWA